MPGANGVQGRHVADIHKVGFLQVHLATAVHVLPPQPPNTDALVAGSRDQPLRPFDK